MSRPVVLVSDPLTRSIGFTTVATNVAGQLQARGWEVHYVGRGRRDQGGAARPFRVHDAEDEPDAVSHLAALASRAARRLPVVVFGRAIEARALEMEARRAGVRRRLDLTYYAPVDTAPVSHELRAFAATMNRIVPATPFAREALGVARTTAPIPHGVDTARFRPLDPAERARVRRERFGLGPDDLLVGFFGRNTAHKRPDLALRVFAHFALGVHARCRRCRRRSASEPALGGRAWTVVTTCRHCGGDDVERGVPSPGARLYLHTELADRHERALSGGWDLEDLARRFGVAPQVAFDRGLTVGRGVTVDELARRMAACDVHVLLYDCGGWELTVLETGACGVPNVITAFAAPPAYAAPFARLVPVVHHVVDGAGVRGLADPDAALEALCDLAGDPEERAALGRRGVQVAAAHDWERIGDAWHALLSEAA